MHRRLSFPLGVLITAALLFLLRPGRGAQPARRGLFQVEIRARPEQLQRVLQGQPLDTAGLSRPMIMPQGFVLLQAIVDEGTRAALLAAEVEVRTITDYRREYARLRRYLPDATDDSQTPALVTVGRLV